MLLLCSVTSPRRQYKGGVDGLRVYANLKLVINVTQINADIYNLIFSIRVCG